MALPISGEAIIAGISGLGGAGSGLAIFRHFATKWAEEREAKDRELADEIREVRERELKEIRDLCTERNSERERATELLRAQLQAEFRTALDGLRTHTDTELARVSNRNHELSNSLGIVMNEMTNQKLFMSSIKEAVDMLTAEVQKGIVAITALTARLEGAGLLRRATDRDTNGG